MNNSNKAVLVVFATLAAVLLVLVVASGACSGAGGGGGGGGNMLSSHTSESGGAPEVSLSNASTEIPTGTNDNEYTITATELKDLLSASTAPVGENARDAATSSNVPTASEVATQLEERGFSDFELSADFELDGTYTGMVEVDYASSEKHPSFFSAYESATGVVWYIYINDGIHIAMPIAGENAFLSKQIILSEKEYVTQYDGVANQYSDFPLSQLTDAIGIQVSRIDKTTLDSYSFEQLEAM